MSSQFVDTLTGVVMVSSFEDDQNAANNNFSKMNLVDLAGSERASRTGAQAHHRTTPGPRGLFVCEAQGRHTQRGRQHQQKFAHS